MKVFVVFACFVFSAQAATTHDDDDGLLEKWIEWKGKHGRNYSDNVEDRFRMSIFLENLKIIKAHNEMHEQGQMSYDMGTNEFSDLVSAT